LEKTEKKKSVGLYVSSALLIITGLVVVLSVLMVYFLTGEGVGSMLAKTIAGFISLGLGFVILFFHEIKHLYVVCTCFSVLSQIRFL